MRNKILTTALLVGLSLVLTACTIGDLPVIGKFLSGKSSLGKEITLNVWGLWESPDVMSALIAKYRETHPNVTINYDDRSVMVVGDYKDRVFTRIGQEGAPDIVMVHNTWVSGLKDYLSSVPPSVMNEQLYTSTFYPICAEDAVFDGKVYGIPFSYDGLMLVYNKKHFAEIDQTTPPTAWEEFRRLALLLTVRGEKDEIIRAGAAMGTANNITFFSDILGLLYSQAGVEIPNDLDSRAAQDALSFYVNFFTKDKVWNAAFPEASAAFAQGKVSMIFIPSWNLLDIINSQPGLDIGVAPVPQALADRPASWGSFWMSVVPKSSRNQAAAWEFLKFLSEEDSQLMMFSEASKYRAFGSLYTSSSLGSQVPNNSYLKPLVLSAPYAKSGIIAARSGNDKEVSAIRDAVNSVLSGVSPSEALKVAKEAILTKK